MESGSDRRNELINIAGEFFFTKGFSKTSIQNIIDKADIAKGTFYHYFKSKDDILDAMTKNYVKGLYKKAYGILDMEMNAIDKLNYFFQEVQGWKMGNMKLMRVLMKVMMSDNNLVLRNRILKHTIKETAPIYCGIIKQGIDEGLFNVSYPELTSRFIITSFVFNGEEMTQLFMEDEYTEEIVKGIKEQLVFFEDVLERLLGTDKGVIKTISDDNLEKMIKGLMEA